MVLGLALGAGFVQRMRTAAPLAATCCSGPRRPRRGAVQAFVDAAAAATAPAVLAQVYLQEHVRLSSLQAGLTLTTFGVAVIVGSTVAGRSSVPLGLDRLAAVGLLAIGVGDGTLVPDHQHCRACLRASRSRVAIRSRLRESDRCSASSSTPT